MKARVFVIGVVSALSLNALAGGFSTRVSYAKMNYEEIYQPETNPTNLIIDFKRDVDNYLSLKARLGMSIDDGVYYENIYYFIYEPVYTSIKAINGFYFDVKIPSETIIKPYGSIGYASVQKSKRYYGSSDEYVSKVNDISYSIGFDVELSKGAINLEYSTYFNDEDKRLNSYSIGYRFDF
jgi:hypothetical protein